MEELKNAIHRLAQLEAEGVEESDVRMKKAWKNYLKAGGSRTMINRGVPKDADFGAVYDRLKNQGMNQNTTKED